MRRMRSCFSFSDGCRRRGDRSATVIDPSSLTIVRDTSDRRDQVAIKLPTIQNRLTGPRTTRTLSRFSHHVHSALNLRGPAPTVSKNLALLRSIVVAVQPPSDLHRATSPCRNSFSATRTPLLRRASYRTRVRALKLEK